MSIQVSGKTVAIIHICKDLSELQTENATYYKGQFIIAINDLGQIGVKVGLWDWKNQLESAAPKFNDLPWLVNPASSGAIGTTPFKIRKGDPQLDETSGNAVITDIRLKGITDPAIYFTGLNVALRDDMVTLDNVAGTLTITGVSPIAPDDYFLIITPTSISPSDITSLENDMALMKKLLSPLTAAGTFWVWKKPYNQIPAGWQEMDEMRGYQLLSWDPTDPATDSSIWAVLGAKNYPITANNIPKFRLNTVVDAEQDLTGHPADTGQEISSQRSMVRMYKKTTGGLNNQPGTETYELCGSSADNVAPTQSPTSSYGVDSPTSVPLLYESRIVMFIEPVPGYFDALIP